MDLETVGPPSPSDWVRVLSGVQSWVFPSKNPTFPTFSRVLSGVQSGFLNWKMGGGTSGFQNWELELFLGFQAVRPRQIPERVQVDSLTVRGVQQENCKEEVGGWVLEFTFWSAAIEALNWSCDPSSFYFLEIWTNVGSNVGSKLDYWIFERIPSGPRGQERFRWFWMCFEACGDSEAIEWPRRVTICWMKVWRQGEINSSQVASLPQVWK